MKNSLTAGGFDLPKPPKRTTVDEDAAAEFLTAERKVKAPKPAPARRRKAATLGERIVAYIPPELAGRMRVRCAKERRTLSSAVTEAVTAWMKARGNEDT